MARAHCRKPGLRDTPEAVADGYGGRAPPRLTGCHGMDIGSYVAYAAALGLAAFIPGPGVTALVARALGSSFEAAVLMLVGLVIGDLFYLTLAVFGLALLAQSFAALFTVIKFASAAYLLYLAWRFWRIEATPESIAAARGERPLAAVGAGLAVTLGNPKTIVFYLALAPAVIDFERVRAAEFAGLAAVTVAVLVTVLLPYVGLATKARTMLARRNALRAIYRSAAAAMAAAAGAIALKDG